MIHFVAIFVTCVFEFSVKYVLSRVVRASFVRNSWREFLFYYVVEGGGVAQFDRNTNAHNLKSSAFGGVFLVVPQVVSDVMSKDENFTTPTVFYSSQYICLSSTMSVSPVEALWQYLLCAQPSIKLTDEMTFFFFKIKVPFHGGDT